MKNYFLLLFAMLVCQQAFSQSSPGIHNRIAMRFGYGLAKSGMGDIAGQQMMLGVQNQFGRHSLVDVRLTGTLFQQTRTFHQIYSVQDRSRGVSLEADYGWALKWKLFMFYPSVGPALRYSHETHPDYISIAYDPANGSITNFEAPSTTENRLRVGATGGLNFDVQVSKVLSLGLRASVQSFKNGDTIQFYGFTLKTSSLRF